jgi:hypothetical protein
LIFYAVNETIYWHRKAFFENEDIDAGLDLAIFYKNLATKNKILQLFLSAFNKILIIFLQFPFTKQSSKLSDNFLLFFRRQY